MKPQSFQAKLELGKLGEQIVKDFCRAEFGLTVYAPERGPEDNGGPEPTDFFIAKLSENDRPRIYLNDVKTKFRRMKYLDTGFNIKHLNRYRCITRETSVPFFIWFVDAFEEWVYGQFLERLEISRYVTSGRKNQRYPWFHFSQVYFPLEMMMKLRPLPKYLCEKIRKQSNHDAAYKYDSIPKFFSYNDGAPKELPSRTAQFDWTEKPTVKK